MTRRRANAGATYTTGGAADMFAALRKAGVRAEHRADWSLEEDEFIFREGSRWGILVWPRKSVV